MAMRAKGRGRGAARSGRALAVIGLLAGGAACATPPVRPKNFPADHTVNIVFSGGCPQRAIAQGNACGPDQPQCIRVKYNEQVLFQSTTPEGKLTDDKLAVQFDPFQGPPGQGVGFVLRTIRMDAKPGTTKRFPYNVQSGTCAPLDPEVQVDW